MFNGHNRGTGFINVTLVNIIFLQKFKINVNTLIKALASTLWFRYIIPSSFIPTNGPVLSCYCSDSSAPDTLENLKVLVKYMLCDTNLVQSPRALIKVKVWFQHNQAILQQTRKSIKQMFEISIAGWLMCTYACQLLGNRIQILWQHSVILESKLWEPSLTLWLTFQFWHLIASWTINGQFMVQLTVQYWRSLEF